MSLINTELKIIMFTLSSEFYYELYHEMSIKCHDQNSGHSKNHNGNSMIHFDPGTNNQIRAQTIASSFLCDLSQLKAAVSGSLGSLKLILTVEM